MKSDEIKSLRAKLKMTQVEFAEVLDVERVTVARLESGKKRPCSLVIRKLNRLVRKEVK